MTVYEFNNAMLQYWERRWSSWIRCQNQISFDYIHHKALQDDAKKVSLSDVSKYT